MRQFLLFFILLLNFVRCSTIPKHYVLSKFSLNEKYHNPIISDRIPNYGDGRTDGCIIMHEMQVFLETADKINFDGTIKDSKSLKPLDEVTLELVFEDRGSDPKYILHTDSSGIFHFELDKNIMEIQASKLGYRTLKLDFKKRKLLRSAR